MLLLEARQTAMTPLCVKSNKYSEYWPNQYKHTFYKYTPLYNSDGDGDDDDDDDEDDDVLFLILR